MNSEASPYNGLPTDIDRINLFISYSHEDESWLNRLRKHLIPLKDRQLLDWWTDHEIRAGQKWRTKIDEALRQAQAAVLLVSPSFFASKFIREDELPLLLSAAQQDALTVVWIPVSHSNYRCTEIEAFQAAYDPKTPLDSLSESALNKAFVTICEEILAVGNEMLRKQKENQEARAMLVKMVEEHERVKEEMEEAIRKASTNNILDRLRKEGLYNPPLDERGWGKFVKPGEFFKPDD